MMKLTAVSPLTAAPSLTRIHWLLSVQTGVILLGSQPARLLDAGLRGRQRIPALGRLHNMLTLPLISVVALYLLKKEIERGAMAGNGGRDTAVLVLNALFVALGIFANLGFEEIGLDLVVVLVLAVLAGGLLWRHGRQPLVVYYTVAYGGGLVITAVYRAVL